VLPATRALYLVRSEPPFEHHSITYIGNLLLFSLSSPHCSTPNG